MSTPLPGRLDSGLPPLARAAAGLSRSGTVLAGVTVLLFVANLALHFPGTLNNDTVSQYRQATSGQYSDWHPPAFAGLWSLLLWVDDGPAPMLAVQLGMYWLGLGLVADALRRQGQPLLCVAALAFGLFPPFLHLNATVAKDAAMAGAWCAAAGLAFWSRVVPAPSRVARLALASAIGVCLLYGTLVRGNAVFGLGPLLAYAVLRKADLGLLRLVVAAVLVALAAIPLTQALNNALFQPRKVHPEHSLFLYDLAGIAHHAGDATLLQPRAQFTDAQLAACYTPYWWDPFSAWGPCGARVVRDSGDYATDGQGLPAQWLQTLLAHPAAYLQHRLRHFNSGLMFLVPLKPIRLTPEYRSASAPEIGVREIQMDLVRKSPVVWPVTWLAWAAGALLLLARAAPRPEVLFGRVLLASALGYAGAYLVVGVATDMRYHFWTLLAVGLATLCNLPAIAAAWRAQDRTLRLTLVAVLAVVVLGTAARLLDWQALV